LTTYRLLGPPAVCPSVLQDDSVVVCMCMPVLGEMDPWVSPALTARPAFPGSVMSGAAGAVSTKVRHPSPRLMLSAPVGRFFFP
jgi:hypothetical protein